jgi:hypothetical protein
MSVIPESLDRLEQLAHELERRGEASIAKQITREVDTLRAETAPPKLMSLAEAAERLGLPSTTTIAHWARTGHLERYRRDGQYLVTARSVAAMAESPVLARELARERELEAALAPFSLREGEELDPEEFSAVWAGRKPWESNDPSRARAGTVIAEGSAHCRRRCLCLSSARLVRADPQGCPTRSRRADLVAAHHLGGYPLPYLALASRESR